MRISAYFQITTFRRSRLFIWSCAYEVDHTCIGTSEFGERRIMDGLRGRKRGEEPQGPIPTALSFERELRQRFAQSPGEGTRSEYITERFLDGTNEKQTADCAPPREKTPPEGGSR